MEPIIVRDKRSSFAGIGIDADTTVICPYCTAGPTTGKLAMAHYLEKEASNENYLVHLRHDAALKQAKVHSRILFAPLDIAGLAQLASGIVGGGS